MHGSFFTRARCRGVSYSGGGFIDPSMQRNWPRYPPYGRANAGPAVVSWSRDLGGGLANRRTFPARRRPPSQGNLLHTCPSAVQQHKPFASATSYDVASGGRLTASHSPCFCTSSTMQPLRLSRISQRDGCDYASQMPSPWAGQPKPRPQLHRTFGANYRRPFPRSRRLSAELIKPLQVHSFSQPWLLSPWQGFHVRRFASGALHCGVTASPGGIHNWSRSSRFLVAHQPLAPDSLHYTHCSSFADPGSQAL